MEKAASFFQKRQKQLGLAASAYVIFLLLSHWQLPSAHVWWIAAFFSIVMNGVYILEAKARREFISREAIVAGVLIVLSILGVVMSPVFVIAAIVGHGLWDLAKHRGAGVPFFAWYTLSCFAVDVLYGAALTVYWVTAARF